MVDKILLAHNPKPAGVYRWSEGSIISFEHHKQMRSPPPIRAKEVSIMRMATSIVVLVGLFLATTTVMSEPILAERSMIEKQESLKRLSRKAIPYDSKGIAHLLQSAVIHGAEKIEGKEGTSIEFDGIDDYLEIPALVLPPDFTLSLWIAVQGGDMWCPAGIISEGSGLDFDLCYLPVRERFEVQRNGKCFKKIVGRLEIGKWQLLSMVRNSAREEIKLFVNGKELVKFPRPLETTDKVLRIGAAGEHSLVGRVSEITLANRAFSQEEIEDIWNKQKERFGSQVIIKQTKEVHSSKWPMILVDKTRIALKDGVGLAVCEAEKHVDNPVARRGGPGSPDERRCQFDGSVYYLDGKFRMWYMARDAHLAFHMAYAESADGIHWVKPNLGLIQYKGNKNNNLIDMPGLFANVFYDPAEPNPERRFKKPVGKGDPNLGGRHALWTFAYSEDGLKWKLEKRLAPATYYWSESQSLFHLGHTWFMYGQSLGAGRVGGEKSEMGPGYGRQVRVFYSKDLDKDPQEWDKAWAWWMRKEKGYEHYQCHQGIKTWLRPCGLIIGLYGIFRDLPIDRNEAANRVIDIGLVLSRDGLNWWEPSPLAKLIPRGKPSEWDSRFLVQGNGFVNVRDKTYLYYCAAGVNGWQRDIGLAILRRDGFGYLWPYYSSGFTERGVCQGFPGHTKTGSFVTVPIHLEDKTKEQVLLNVGNLGKESFVKVELLDREGVPIPGYTLKEADAITTNGITVPATWRGNALLKSVSSDTIHLHVVMQGNRYRVPHLYAVYFSQPQNVEQ